MSEFGGNIGGNIGGFGGDFGKFGGGKFGGCNSAVAHFLATVSPGVNVVLQYDCQPPAYGCFQGFQGGNIILTNYNGFPGLVRIAANRVNAVSTWCGGGF